MLRLHNRLNEVLFKALVRCHTTALEKYFNKIFCKSYLHLLTDEIKWKRVFVYAVRNQIVISDGLLFPYRGLIRAFRQRQHEFLFLG